MKERIPLIQALSWIVGVTLVSSIVMHKTIQYGFAKKKQSSTSSASYIDYIVQTGPYKEALRSDYLMEVLGLSIDRPVLFSSFDLIAAEDKIKNLPMVKEATVKKMSPNMTYIDYTLKKPVVWAADFVNAALDREGSLFPVHPFFSPKKMPEIYLGQEGLAMMDLLKFGSRLQGKYIDVAFTLLDLLLALGQDRFVVKKIDVSKAYAPSLGKREIVVCLENEIYTQNQEGPVSATHFLRLSSRRFKDEIMNYLTLRDTLLESEKQEAAALPKGTQSLKAKVIDLRLEQLAFIQ